MRKGLLAAALAILFSLATAHAQPSATPVSSTPPPATPYATAAPASVPAASTPTPSPTASPVTTSTATTAPNTTTAAPDPARPVGAKAASALPPEKAQPVRIPRFETQPVIDGKLDEAAWQQAAVLKDFYQIQPGDNIEPSKRTEALIGYDAKFLYIAFRAFDERDKVRATVPKRDQIFEDDYVGMFLDTFNDQRKAYAFFFSPLGVQADGILTDGVSEDYSLDVVMESKGELNETGFTVEIAIPFKSLRYEAGKDKLWGAHFFRRIKRFNNELDSWMPFSRDKSGTMNQAGHITGLEGISTERTVEIIPSLTVSETGKRVRTLQRSLLRSNSALVDPGRFVNTPIDFDPGLTAKLGISSTMTLDLAINPDFAQVEADSTVVTANQRFPIFFPEKRPFFLEGIDIFQTLIAAVNTRTIIDPDVAVKLSGKSGRNTYGIMVASDNAPGNFSEEERTDPDLFPSIERFLDKNASIGVIRLKRDIGKENTIGLLATTYNFIEKHNHMGGFDARFRLNPKTTLTAQVLGSNSRRFFFDPDRGENVYRTGNGMAYAYNLSSFGRHFGYELAGVGRSHMFRADVGFNRRFNTNNHTLFAQYQSEPKPKAQIVQWRVFNFIGTNFDWRSRIQRWDNNTQLRFSFQHQGFLGLGVEEGYERVFEEEFGAKRTAIRTGTFAGDDAERQAYRKTFYIYGGVTPSKKYSMFLLTVRNWGVLDFDFGNGPKFPRVSPVALLNPSAPLDPGAGNELYIESNFTYQPTSALRLSLDYTKDRLTRNDTERVAFDDNIYSLRGTYQFTRFTFARARMDYSSLAARVRAQFLAGWTPNPGTSFYVGYNDDLNRNGSNPFTGQIEPGLRRNGRTLFIKMSYLFRRSL